MDQLIVHIQDQDHLIGENETTVCGIPVPIGTGTVKEATSPCPVCYPDAVVDAEPAKKKLGRPPKVKSASA